MSKQSALLERLQTTTKGLTYMSESDYPVEPFIWEGEGKDDFTAKDILKVMKYPSRAPVKVIDLDEFFSRLTQEQDWHGPQEKKEVKQYKKLVSLLKESLTNLQVFKVGKINIDIYVVGKTADGDFAGVTTKAVET